MDEHSDRVGAWLDELLALEGWERSRRLEEVRKSVPDLAAEILRRLEVLEKPIVNPDSTMIAALRDAVRSAGESSGPGAAPDQRQDDWGEAVAALGRLAGFKDRYRAVGTLGIGGMGVVTKAFDRRLGRSVALKTPHSEDGAPAQLELRMRLLREAEVMSRLDHPSIVPVHDVGMTSDGAPYFSMSAIKGVSFDRILTASDRAGINGREIRQLVQVGEALAHAHTRGILHRDVKPSNILVGSRGRTYLLDWGVAFDMQSRNGGPGTSDCEVRGGVSDATSSQTLAGTIVGTAPYLAPELLGEKPVQPSPSLDVYSFGCLMYEVLAGVAPFRDSAASKESSAQLRERIRRVEPTALGDQCGRQFAHLVKIAETAMHRDPASRFGTMDDVLDELTRFLDDRDSSRFSEPISVRAVKFVRRHPVITATGGVVLLAASGFAVMQRQIHAKSKQIGGLNLQVASLEPNALLSRLLNLEGLIDPSRSNAEEYQPTAPDSVDHYRDWLAEVNAIGAAVTKYAAALPAEARTPFDVAATYDEPIPGPASFEAAWVRENIELTLRDLEEATDEQKLQASWPEDEAELIDDVASWEEQLRQLAAMRDPRLEGILERDKGSGEESRTVAAIANVWGRFQDGPDRHGWVSRTKTLVERMSQPDVPNAWGRGWDESWRIAVESIADSTRCPAYGGLRVTPQKDLLPLRQDESTGLWEFAHLPSGDLPSSVDSGERYQLGPTDCVVFVLLPGGTLSIGASSDESHSQYDPFQASQAGDVTLAEVTLDPFYLGKYEVTQGQWRFWHARNPSQMSEERGVEGVDITDVHPVESISWNEAHRFAWTLGCELPTSAQWEYGNRAGTVTPWWTGADRDSIYDSANLLDESALNIKGYRLKPEPIDDGFPLHAPVGSFAPNAFGLYDTMGNVWEYCLDPYNFDLDVRIRKGDGLGLPWASPTCITRGGSFAFPADPARSAYRSSAHRNRPTTQHGLRLARQLVVD